MENFDFYRQVYQGQILSQEQWAVFGLRARERLERWRRIWTVVATPEALAMAVCAMAEALYAFEDGSGAVRSAAIGSVSVQYGSCVDLSAEGQERLLVQILRRYADVYRGVSA
jgi:hypothetical protein